jgi:serine/threonine-protein kinase HipA
MTSENRYDEAYVWIWLPSAAEPVVAGRLSRDDTNIVFNYGRSYLERDDRIALYAPELPLEPGTIPLLSGLTMPSAIRDASPDAWGRRVIINRTLGVKRAGAKGASAGGIELDELTYLLESGSDRIGALDFQLSATDYVPRNRQSASLGDLMTAAERVEQSLPLDPELDQALQHGTSLGGARPKVLIDADSRKYIAKFSASGDLHNVVKAEFVAMRLASLAGLNVAPARLERALGKHVFLVERFDRVHAGDIWHRRALVSALTILELDEMMARYASYEQLAEIIRHRFTDPKGSLRELFGRLIFNILCGNTDDHARNHAAFWDGRMLSLTPAYDVCPQLRSGGQASQAMLIQGNRNASQLATCLHAAPNFLLSAAEAKQIITRQIAAIKAHWDSVCDEAKLNAGERDILWNGAFLKRFAFEGLDGEFTPEG